MTPSAPAIPDTIAALAPQMTAWRHEIHAWPELGFEEVKTSALVIRELRALGLDVHTGLGGTGVVAVVDSGTPGLSIGLRADMDALPMDEVADERGELSYRSQRPGVAHTCGHDGHTSALLGTARHLVAHPP
ncbi:MAG: M20/M25/M40 family metallo-hydrolase, partial [Luteimonas sp.]